MMNIEEAKKKSYAISGGSQNIEDPLRFISRLTGARRVVNEIKIPAESSLLFEDGFKAIENFYQRDEEIPSDDGSQDNIKGVENPLKSENDLLTSLIEKDPAILNHLYFRKNQIPKALSKLKAKEDQGDKSGFLGKRSTLSKMSDEKEKELTPQKFKYCDPKTGAYFNSIEDFKKIRQLQASDDRRRIDRSQHYLGVLNSVKHKKLVQLLADSD